MKILRSCWWMINAGALIWQFAACGWAQSYPSKPVRLLVPYGAGGGADVMARIIAAGLAQPLGQQVIVENRSGAAGNIGTEVAARAPADGYTVLEISQTNAVNVSLYRNLAYDLVRDFAPVTELAWFPNVLVVHPSLPVRSVGDLVRLAKARPGALNYASAGVGSATFFAAETFKLQAGINLLHVPYRGGGESLTAVIAGEAPVYFPNLAVTLPYVKQGKLRMVAVATAKRLAMAPEYPTVAESGYPGYESTNWFGLLVPARTPKETIATLRSATVTALNNPGVGKRMSDLGFIGVGSEPEEFGAHIRSEIATLAKVIRQTGMTAE